MAPLVQGRALVFHMVYIFHHPMPEKYSKKSLLKLNNIKRNMNLFFILERKEIKI